MAQQRRGGFKRRKKVDYIAANKIEYVDYKDTELLSRFVSERGKILPRRVTGTSAKNQRKVTTAIKRARVMALIGIIVMFLGILGVVLDGWNQNGMLTLDYSSQIAQVPIWFPMLILLLAAAIFYMVVMIMRALDKLLINFQKDSYFNSENITYLSKILRCLLIATGIQLAVNLIFNFLNLEHVSDLFELSLKDYWFNIVLLVVNYIGILVIKHGVQLQKDYDEII